MPVNIFKKFRKKRTTKPEVNDDPVKVDSDLTTPQTSESTCGDYNPASNDTDDDDAFMKDYNGIKSRDGLPVISSGSGDHFRPSDVAGVVQSVSGYKKNRPGTVPTVHESAFSGPPRYDWIDVESAAAIKVQSIFRRNKALQKLEDEGKITASMRNKIRSRQSRKTNMTSEDVPAVFRFCGLGFLFSDAVGGDSEVLNEKKKSKSEEKRQLQLANEAKKRKFRMRKKPMMNIEEAVEVVDDVNL